MDLSLTRTLAISTMLFAAGCLRADSLPDLQRRPSARPSDMPKLSSLTLDTAGEAITTPEEWARRREQLRREWTAVLGAFPSKKVPLSPEFLEKEELPGFSRQKVTYQIEEDVRTDAMLLVPKGSKGKLPAIVLFHPTYPNHYARAVGLEDKEEPERHQAVQLVEQGYVVLVPRCFIYADPPPDAPRTQGTQFFVSNVRRMQERHPTWCGMTRMTWDGIRALDFIETLPKVNPRRIGIFGHSLGAKEVIYVAAFDKRVKCTVSSEGGVGINFSNWSDVWYLGPKAAKPEFQREHHELLGMVAPRPFLLLAGESADNNRSWAFIEATLPVYRLLGSPQNLGWFNHGLGHRYGGEARTVAEAFFDRHLKQLGKPNSSRTDRHLSMTAP